MSSRADNTTRANGAIGTPSDGGSAYDTFGTWTIASNKVVETGGGARVNAVLETSDADGTLSFTISANPNGDKVGGCVRQDANNDFIALYCTNTFAALRDVAAGSESALGLYNPGTLTFPLNVSIVLSGDQIEVFLAGVSRIGPVTVAHNQTATKHGWYADQIVAGHQLTNLAWTPAGGSPATTYTATRSPTTQAVGGTVQITLTPDGSTTDQVTLSDGGAGGSFDVNPKTLTGTTPVVVTYTCPGTPQTVTISFTNNGGLSNPSSVTITVVSGTLTIGAGLVAHQLFQRDRIGKGQGYADVVVPYTYTGAPPAIEGSSGGAFATVVSTPSGGSGFAKLRLPVGVYTITLRFSSDHTITSSVANVKVGSKWIIAGQSNTQNLFTNTQSYTGTANWASKFDQTDTWAVLADPVDASGTGGSGGSLWPPFGSHVVTDGGVPVAIVPCGVGGTKIEDYWQPGQTAYDAMIAQALTDSGEDGVEGLIWLQGESNTGNTSEDTYYGYEGTMIDDWWERTHKPVVVVLLGPNRTGAPTINAAKVRTAQTRRGAIVHVVTPNYDNDPHWTTNANATAVADAIWDALDPLLYAATAAGGGLLGHSAGMTGGMNRS